MAYSQKVVLMVHSKRLHGQIWLAVLKSQKISVISEAPEINLLENINRLKEAGLDLPDALLVDVGLRNFNPFAFCRWCRENCPTVKVILVNPSRQEITPSEQQWAMLQGAADLLPSFDIDNLVSSVADRVKRVLKSLDGQPLDNGALISVLLAMKRELDIRRGLTANGSQPAHAELPTLNGKSLSLPSAPSTPSADDAPKVPKPTIAEPTVEKPKEGRSLVRRLMDGVQLPGLSEKAIGSSNPPAPPNRKTDKPPTPPASNPDTEDIPPDDDPPPVRKYRGKSY
jgi:CheY-like chemotaxis protein